MASQEQWRQSSKENGQGPLQSLPPPPHARQPFSSQQQGHPVLPPPPSLGNNGGRNQSYYPSLPSISGLGNNVAQHSGYNLPAMSGQSSQQINHSAQSPSTSQAPLSSLSSAVSAQQAILESPPPSNASVSGQHAPGQQSQGQQLGGPSQLTQHQAASLLPMTQGQVTAQALAQAAAGTAAQQIAAYRPLNVKDALSYLDQVKVQFQNQPDVYNRFLDIMKDFKSQSIDTPGVIDRVSTLFSGHPNLIQGFNTFLPPGYRIECSTDPSDPNPIRVTTPMGTTTRPDGQMPAYDPSRAWQSEQYSYNNEPLSGTTNSMSQLQAVANGSRQASQSEQKRLGGPVEFNHAISYVNKIKNRFSSQPDIYKNFLEILQTYQREQKPIADVYAQVTMLFRDAPDLLDDFKQFLPEAAHQRSASSPDSAVYSPATRLPPVGNFAPPSVPKEKKKRSSQAIDPGQIPITTAQGLVDIPSQVSSLRGGPNKKVKPNAKVDVHSISPTLTPMIPEPLPPPDRAAPSAEELAFFDRVKKFIGNKQTYNEFLKLLNLFSQDIIDRNVLVEKAEPFIGGSKDLMDWFKRCVEFDAGTLSIENIPYKRHQLDLSLCKSYGPSYRLLPKSETHMPCSGRDEMCWEVLNDEWVSHPTWASEDSGFVAHRKNQFEEVLHRIEEERHEYDHNVEGNLRTIQILEPIANRIANMTPEEKANFKLAPGLGHSSKSIYQSIIKKIYDRERGQEVIDALHENPAVAVPIVLKRLKQKDEEWKRAQREWNKTWRETESRVFYKSLDHQGLTFKQSDKKTLTTKSLVTEIDTVKKEQMNKRLNPLTPGPKYQLQYSFEQSDIISDVIRLINCHLIHSNTFSSNDREKMDGFIKAFIPLFFGVPIAESTEQSPSESQANSADEESDASSFSNKKSRATKDGDLLRDVLKKARQGRQKRDRDDESREDTPDVAGSGEESHRTENGNDDLNLPDTVEKAGEIWIQHVTKRDDQVADGLDVPSPDRKRTKFNLFANTTIYCFFRLFQVIYQRLEQVKSLESEVSADIASRKPVEFAKELGILSNKIQDMGLAFTSENCYGQLLDMCEKVIEGELEHQWFEESLRQAYRNRAFKMYTIDKAIQAIAKHVHTIISDSKCSDIIMLYNKDRHLPKTTSREQIIYRIQVETLLGPDENVFRLEFNEGTSLLAIQLFSPDDLTLNDAVTADEKWKYYLTSYVMSSPTEGVPVDKVKMPFLRRNLPTEDTDVEESEISPAKNTYSNSGLRIRICMNTYKMFYEEFTEDSFVRLGVKSYKKLPWKIDNLIR